MRHQVPGSIRNATCILLLILVCNKADAQRFLSSSNAKPIVGLENPIYEEAFFKQLIIHKGFQIVFNTTTLIPEWAAYELTKEEAEGESPRGRHFTVDPEVNGPQGDNDDYRNSGWDRGHMVPAGDMKADEQMMRESFYFSNICPQNRNLNGGDWRTLEELCRQYAIQYGRVYVVCGPIIGNNIYGRLGAHQIVIPDAFFKVILTIRDGKYEGIGFIMNNEAGHRKLNAYVKTIDEVEEVTGLDFFHLLPDKIENEIEAKYNLATWGIRPVDNN